MKECWLKMGKGAGIFVLADSLLRRVVLPLVLLAAVIFRFNLFSFVYLLVLLVSTLLPGPTLKSQRVVSLILFAVLLVFSGLVSVAQALFQISLATDYTLTACEGVEPIWRQSGFVQYNIPAVDVVRHLLPDVVVFIVALITLCVNARVVTLHRRKEGEEEEGGVGEGGGGESPDDDGVTVQDGAERQLEGMGREEDTGDGTLSDELEDLSSGARTLPFPAHVQCYWRTPKVLTYFMELAIFIFLGLSGVAIPSVTSFVYYAAFILLLAIWSVHLRLQRLVRGLRVLLMLYSSLHLLLLHLYQFESAQDGIPIQPNNTTSSLLARLFGLTPIILTDCTRPTELRLWPNIPYTLILNPIFVLILFWLLATELRMWLFTPHYLWSQYSSYCLPVLDQHPSSRVVCITRAGRHREQTLWTQYGTYTIHGDRALESEPSSATELNGGAPAQSTSRKRRLRVGRVAWEKVWNKVVEFAESTWSTLMSISYAFAIVAMMVWSVLYISWPALVLLLWACAIWLIPRVNPRNSLYYTSPLLVVYTLALLLLQYVNSLELTASELPRYPSLGSECTEEGAVLGCKSLVLLFKTLLAVLFFAAFHEFVRIVKEKVRERHQRHTPDGEVPLTEVHASEDPTSNDPTTSQVSKAQLVTSHFYTSLKLLLSTYWVLAVIGAFLLVTLAGQPSLLKTVYLVFFFIFLITYQVFRRYWYYLTVPTWWFLIVYAVLDLILIYTYQFEVVSDAWEMAYQRTGLNISSEDLFASIGLFEFDTHQARSLIVSLVPPAVFIAVMALQLRYFRPDSRLASQHAAKSGLSALDLSSLLPKFVQERIRAAEAEAEEGEGEQEEQDEELQESLVHISEEEAASARHSVLRHRTASIASSTARSSSKLYRCYQLTMYLFAKTKQIVVDLVHLLWRFLELHMHKITMLVLFVVALSEISAGYWILLLMLLIAIPLPYLNPLMYPVVTLYLGLLTTLKMIYQLPFIQQGAFDFNRSDCGNFAVNPVQSDADWLGFRKAENVAGYIYAPIISGLLLSLWFSARRYQAYHYHSEAITVEAWEKGALFLKVTRWQAERSIVGAVKFLINHFFELYGVEVSWVMLAITVAVRIDVYGVLYALVLGVLLFTPRRFLAPVWFCYLLVHGVFLLLQYLLVLGVPPGVCLGAEGNSDYPWSAINPAALKKWLFLPEAQQQILDKNLLYADFLVYLLVCLQMHYFHDSPLSKAREEMGEVPSSLFKFQYWLDYVKVVVVRYSFWLSLFLLFFTAVSRVSLFGVLYLLLCFVFLYRGEEMLKDRQRNRHRIWALLRAATWMVLLLRVTLQILDCVYSKFISEPCLLTLLFNGGCNRAEYYGSSGADCPSGPESVGLWVDALNFAVVTIQIILLDTPYSEAIRMELKEKEEHALYFADVFDRKVEERQQEANEKRERNLQELRDRADELSETTNRVDHFLYAGVTVPSDIQLRKPHKTLTAEERRERDEADSETLSTTSDEPKSKTEADVESLPSEAGGERSKLAKAWKFVYDAAVEFVDVVIEWLESTSALYREVVGELKPQIELQESKETTISPDSAEGIPFAESTDTYGTIEETPRKVVETRPDHLSKDKVVVEVHQDPVDERSLSSYKAAVVEGDILAGQENGDQSRSEKDAAHPDVDGKEPLAALEGQPKVRKTVLFDERGDVLIEELKLVPTEKDQRQIEEFEAEFGKKAEDYSKRPKRLFVALLYAFLAHSEYIVYILVILNAIINGSILSLVYVFFLFLWGMLSIPWPSKVFWLTMIFYAMIVMTVKYAFQFKDITYWRNTFSESSGLYPPRVIGILYHKNFFSNAVWDVLLLIALLFHRGLLKQSGLWRDSKRIKVSNILKQVWFSVKRFVSRLLNPDISQGATDYYVPMLFFDILCILTIAFGVSSFGIGIQNENVAAVATYIQSNYIPLPFVIMLLLQFLSMVVDRGIYLRRSLGARFVFHILLLVIWHVWLFFLLPSNFLTGRPFTQNAAAQCIYFFKCCYFIMSALQIVAGYPNQILGYFLTSKYTAVSGLAFQVYRAIPILSELREVMDWTFTDTTLSLLHWFRVQEIYAQIYVVKVRREREKSSPRYLGEPQSFLLKILLGALMVTVLVLLIWGPLLVISLINTTSQPNPPIAANIKLTIAGFQPLVEMDVQQESIKALSAAQYTNLTNRFANTPAFPLFSQQFQRQDFHQVLFSGESTSLWTISPPSRDLLRQQLDEVTNDPTHSILLQFSWTITRAPSTAGLAAESVSGVNERMLTNSTDYTTIMGLLENLDLSDAQTNVSFPNLYPSFIDAPANGASANLTTVSRYVSNNANVSCIARLNMTTTGEAEWWTLSQKSSYFLSDEPPGSLEMIIYSERIAPPIFSAIAGLGIVGLYLSVVLVVGRFMRGYITQLPSQLLVDEIVNPDPLLQLCSDIFLVRESKDFRLEEILVGKLFFIFRSPERIIKLTENTKFKQE